MVPGGPENLLHLPRPLGGGAQPLGCLALASSPWPLYSRLSTPFPDFTVEVEVKRGARTAVAAPVPVFLDLDSVPLVVLSVGAVARPYLYYSERPCPRKVLLGG